MFSVATIAGEVNVDRGGVFPHSGPFEIRLKLMSPDWSGCECNDEGPNNSPNSPIQLSPRIPISKSPPSPRPCSSLNYRLAHLQTKVNTHQSSCSRSRICSPGLHLSEAKYSPSRAARCCSRTRRSTRLRRTLRGSWSPGGDDRLDDGVMLECGCCRDLFVTQLCSNIK